MNFILVDQLTKHIYQKILNFGIAFFNEYRIYQV